MGSKGRGAIPDMVLGSAVRGVLQLAPAPVLVVK
jgi:nucleotide-binding universal stress UspA family protein